MTLSEISTKYKCKGTAFINVKRFAEDRLGEGLYESIATASGMDRQGKTSPATWYPAMHYIKIQEDLSKRSNMSLRDFCIECTTFILEVDLNGVYRFFIKLGGPDRVMASVPRMARTYNNLFTYEIIENTKGFHKAKIIHPISVYEWAIGSCEGGVRGILNICNKPMKTFDELDKRVFSEAGEDMMEVIFELTY